MEPIPPVPCDPARLFSILYCGVIALQTLIHYREQLQFFRTQPDRVYGQPPLLLGLVPLPTGNERLFMAAGGGFILALAAAAGGFAPRASPAAALACYLFYFPAILPHGYVMRKTNLIPIVLAIMIMAPGQAIVLVRLSLSLVYLSAGVEKLLASGVRWADGRNLQAYLLEHYLYTERPQALWLARRARLCRWLSTGVLIWELSFWLIMFFPALIPFYALVGLAVHAGTSVAMRIHYWVYFCPAYIVFATPWLCAWIASWT